jgi:hypothetical protein
MVKLKNGQEFDPFASNQELDWIVEHNQPNPESKEIPVYEGVVPAEVKIYQPAGKLIKELFYNIQQTSYYCDFTLESAQFAFEKTS